jgi:hypothetical protein
LKITSRRKGISQSMDLFIIIAAVLGVGGVVSASIYNLVNSATANSSIIVVGASLRAGTASPLAISITVKNNGGSPISCATAGSCQVVFAGTSTGSTAATCSGSCTIASGGSLNWGLGSAAGPLTFQVTSSSTSFAPGAQTSFAIEGTLTSGTGATYWTAGTPVTINLLFGTASAQVTVVSQ